MVYSRLPSVPEHLILDQGGDLISSLVVASTLSSWSSSPASSPIAKGVCEAAGIRAHIARAGVLFEYNIEQTFNLQYGYRYLQNEQLTRLTKVKVCENEIKRNNFKKKTALDIVSVGEKRREQRNKKRKVITCSIRSRPIGINLVSLLSNYRRKYELFYSNDDLAKPQSFTKLLIRYLKQFWPLYSKSKFLKQLSFFFFPSFSHH